MKYFGTDKKNKNLFKLCLMCCLLATPQLLNAQSSNHWTRNFNEESSLLSGAVVGGGAGAAAIFYNPAIISEIEASNLSVNASLFSVDFLKSQNAWGDNMDLVQMRFVVIPRFISYMIKLKNAPKLSLEVAFMNNENYSVNDVNSVDEFIDILPRFEGKERYTAFYSYNNKFRDDWLGFGGSRRINDKLVMGASMFVSARSMEYSYQVDIEAGPLLDFIGDPESLYYTAKFKDQDYLRFNDYRLIWKLGLQYQTDRLSFGLNITTPSLGVYTDAKRVMRKVSQSDINDANGESVPNYLVYDYAEKKDVTVNYKSPLSIAAGITYSNPNETKVLYATVEYFSKLDAYRMVSTKENNDIISGELKKALDYDDWLTHFWGAKSLTNVALGYRWIAKENLMVLGGFRTDFNYRKGIDSKPHIKSRTINGFKMDRYHLTGGLTLRILGQDLMAGMQYSFGFEKNQEQFINLSDPLEYNPENFTALQGVKENTMTTVLNSLSLYFGATINFGQNRDKND